MSSKTVRNITPERWAYLKALQWSGGRYIHVSARIAHLPNPDGLTTRSIALKRDRRVPPSGAMHGYTYDAGRNKAKRQRAVRRRVAA